MGMVFGIQREEEPSYTVVLDRTTGVTPPLSTPYEIRQYGTRYAIEAAFEDSSGDNKDETRSPFMKLAGYIGVLSDPQNEGREGIAMTAPVAMQRGGVGGDDDDKSKKKKGEKIAMTAPVAMHRDNAGTGDAADTTTTQKKMQFFLPSKYDSLDKIPTPTNPDVTIHVVPPAVGAVHRYSGTFSETKSRKRAKALVEALRADGAEVDMDEALESYVFMGYNPPFTIPIFRRNEVWIELSKEQVETLTKNHGGDAAGTEDAEN